VAGRDLIRPGKESENLSNIGKQVKTKVRFITDNFKKVVGRLKTLLIADWNRLFPWAGEGRAVPCLQEEKFISRVVL
jgi:hypothetical protein